MGAGALNYRVTLQQRTTGKDSFGQPVPGGWTTVATFWADVRHQSGLEALRSGMDVSTAKASVRIRYRSGVDAGMQLLIEGRAYDIKSVLPDSKRAFIDLVCETVNLKT